MENDEFSGVFVEVSGRVQGVGFRYSVYQLSRKLGLAGWVKNTAEGSVRVFAEGKKENVEKLIDWLHKGPSGARVDTIRVDRVDFSGHLTSFEIKL